MKKEILKLRSEGKNYNQIKKILGCSKSTISYHCGDGQKQKSNERQRRNRKKVDIIIKEKIYKYLFYRVRNYKREVNKRDKKTGIFNSKSAYRKVFGSKVCYLSGRKIELDNPKTYHLDHIIPISKGGKNTLKNMGVAIRDANQAKGDMFVDDFIKLCIDVCRYNGYSVEQICNIK